MSAVAALRSESLFPTALPEVSKEFAWLIARRAAQGGVLGAAVGLSYFSASVPIIIDADADLMDTFRSTVVRGSFQTMVLMVLLTLAAHFTSSTASRLAGFALAIAGAIVLNQVYWGINDIGYFEEGGFDLVRTRLYSLWLLLAVAGVVAAYLASWERTQRSLRALRAAQLTQQRAEHGVLESRLNVMRARVDPEFLFESLGAVRSLYARGPNAAEELLDELIRYLRATLPQAREKSGSLAQEVHLAATYLDVRSRLGGRRFRFDAELAPEIADAFFPPLVLMPLVDDAVRRVRHDCLRIAVRARLVQGRVRVTLEDNGAPDDPEAAATRDLVMPLKAFFGPDAQMTSRSDSAGRVVTLDYLPATAAPRKESP
jgi:hypothetical protein